MPTISLCMIVKNEQDVLGRALNSARGIYDELIIVDTGSQDKTVEIAQNYTDKIYTFEWINDFAKARNYAFSFAKSDYIMWLDADDVITEENRKKIIEIKENLDFSVDIAMLKYCVSFDNDGNPTFEYYRERIIKNDGKHLFEGEVHEAIPLFGNIRYYDAAIYHKKIRQNPPRRNLKIYKGLIADGKQLNARQLYYYGRELYYNNEYEDSLKAFDELFEINDAYVENLIDACKIAAYDLYALKKENDALRSLFRSFSFDTPRADICCDIAKHFFDRDNYRIAVYWYKRALDCDRSITGGFISRDCFDFLPYIQLCVCHYRLGDIQKAESYNKLAYGIKPNNEAVQKNLRLFSELKASRK